LRRLYIVAYDICDPKRLRRVFRTVKGYGEHLQYSVFRCDLTPTQRLQLAAKLEQIIDHGVDQVMLVDLGPTAGQTHSTVYLGRPGPVDEPRGPKVF
jgi:CRISPR-associated protein Cas2